MRLSRLVMFLAAAACLTSSLSAESKTLHLEVGPAKADRTNVPVKVVVSLPQQLDNVKTAQLTIGNEKVWGQLTGLSLLHNEGEAASGETLRELHFVLPEAKAGAVVNVEATVATDGPKPAEVFAWSKEEDTHIDLTFAGKPVARYMKEAYDDSTPENRERTYKVYHHVFDPNGKSLLTKGAGGRYPHHRGIYYGFSKTSYGDKLQKKADIWHCRGGVHQLQQGVTDSAAGPVLGRHRLAIAWMGNDKQMFAKEHRELTFYYAPGGLLVEFASKLEAVDGKLKLDGDPQHAGFQFRASNEVNDKTAGETYYVRPDGVDKPGSYKQGQHQPWNAMSFVLGEQRYTTCYLDHPENPKPAHYSERNYGRFGSYFVAETEGEKTIDVNYRLWIQPGEMDVAGVSAHAKNFVEPLKVTVK